MTGRNPKSRERFTSTYVIRWFILACNLLLFWVRVSFTLKQQLLKNRNTVGTIKMQMSSTEVQSILREYELHYGAWNSGGSTNRLLMSRPSFVIYTSRAPLSSTPSPSSGTRERKEIRISASRRFLWGQSAGSNTGSLVHHVLLFAAL